MGVKHLYNIYSFGKPFGPGNRWMIGTGLGTRLDLAQEMSLNIEGTVHQELWIGSPVSPYFLHMDRLQLYNSLKFLFGWTMDNRITLHVGPTLNVSVAETRSEGEIHGYHRIAPYSFYNRTHSNYDQTRVQMWVGIEGGIAF